MKINCENFEPLAEYSDILPKAISLFETTGQTRLDELGILPQTVQESAFSLSFFDKKGMQSINAKYREIDAPTDVLSFPMWENEEGLFTPPEDWDELPLGDIVVCPEIVAQNAKENGKSFNEELALVIFHGLLHLCGYDHDTDERKAEMWKEQDALVAKFMKEV